MDFRSDQFSFGDLLYEMVAVGGVARSGRRDQNAILTGARAASGLPHETRPVRGSSGDASRKSRNGIRRRAYLARDLATIRDDVPRRPATVVGAVARRPPPRRLRSPGGSGRSGRLAAVSLSAATPKIPFPVQRRPFGGGLRRRRFPPMETFYSAAWEGGRLFY